ncbi:hypothetical protein CCUS01_09932 [Colletotrichum cuscutae]|uniref:Uncharacterized protein n=1 Tax=Colletotrichum cuscutae TaxID=1209917 RepID=A0AAI9XQS5_9PEZI|nr:hypothetical protein CCUS01_09932 [Colletotrichum cuscutae]
MPSCFPRGNPETWLCRSHTWTAIIRMQAEDCSLLSPREPHARHTNHDSLPAQLGTQTNHGVSSTIDHIQFDDEGVARVRPSLFLSRDHRLHPAETPLRLNTSFQSSVGNLVSLPYRNQGTLLCESRSRYRISGKTRISAATRSRTLAWSQSILLNLFGIVVDMVRNGPWVRGSANSRLGSQATALVAPVAVTVDYGQHHAYHGLRLIWSRIEGTIHHDVLDPRSWAFRYGHEHVEFPTLVLGSESATCGPRGSNEGKVPIVCPFPPWRDDLHIKDMAGRIGHGDKDEAVAPKMKAGKIGWTKVEEDHAFQGHGKCRGERQAKRAKVGAKRIGIRRMCHDERTPVAYPARHGKRMALSKRANGAGIVFALGIRRPTPLGQVNMHKQKQTLPTLTYCIEYLPVDEEDGVLGSVGARMRLRVVGWSEESDENSDPSMDGPTNEGHVDLTLEGVEAPSKVQSDKGSEARSLAGEGECREESDWRASRKRMARSEEEMTGLDEGIRKC